MTTILLLLIIDMMSDNVSVPLWTYLALILSAFVWNVFFAMANTPYPCEHEEDVDAR